MEKIKFGLSRKIFLMLVGILVIPMITNAGSLLILTRTAKDYQQLINIDNAVALQSKDLERLSLGLQNDLLFYAINVDDMMHRKFARKEILKELDKIIAKTEDLQLLIEKTKFKEKATPIQDEASSELLRLKTNLEKRMDMIEKTIRLNTPEAVSKAIVAIRHVSIEGPLGTFIGDIKAIQSMSTKSLEESLAKIELRNRNFIILIFAGLVAAIILAIIMITAFTISLKKVLVRITKQVYDLSQGQGDLTKRITLNTNDELGDIADHLNQFLETLNSLILKIKSITKESSFLSDELASSSRVSSRSVSDINLKVEDIKQISDSLENNIEQINAIFEKVQNFISKVDVSITAQSKQIIDSSSSIDEMKTSIDNLSQESSDKLVVANALRDKAQKGESQMELTTVAISEIESSTNLIIDMLEVINNIANQTGLLAMNAAIEAAHAGDAGKGFSVVADEIQKLSVETAENAGNITDEMDEIIGHIRKSVVYSKDTSIIFKQIVEEVEEVTTGFREMNFAMKDLSTGSETISESIGSLVESSEELTSSAGTMDSQILAVSRSLRNLKTQSVNTTNGMNEITKALAVIGTAIDGVRETGSHNVRNVQELESLVGNFIVEDPYNLQINSQNEISESPGKQTSEEEIQKPTAYSKKKESHPLKNTAKNQDDNNSDTESVDIIAELTEESVQAKTTTSVLNENIKNTSKDYEESS